MKQLLDSLQPAAAGAVVTKRDGAVHVTGLRSQWSYAARARFRRQRLNGSIRITLRASVPVGKVSAGVLTASERDFIVEKPVPDGDTTTIVLDVENASDASAVVLRTWE